MKNPINTIKQKYYKYNPAEFQPIRMNGELYNKWEFHFYRLRCILQALAIRPYKYN